MLERLLLPENHANRDPAQGSRRVTRLFDEFEKAKSSAQKEEVEKRASMRAVICAIVMLLVVPIFGQQRGVVRGVAVLKTQAQTGVPVEITITGTNPCGAVRVDPGDGSESVTHAISQVPTTVRYVYRKAGRFQVPRRGHGVATASPRPLSKSLLRPRRRHLLRRESVHPHATCSTWTGTTTAL